MMCYSVMTHAGILGKRNSELSQQESNHDGKMTKQSLFKRSGGDVNNA